jgi:hypothetical protein
VSIDCIDTREDMLIRQSKRVEGQIQGTQDKSEKVKSEVRHKNLEQWTKSSDDRKRLYKYKRRHNSHKRERLRRDWIWCTTRMIPSVNEYALCLSSCLACPLATSKLNTAKLVVVIPTPDCMPRES